MAPHHFLERKRLLVCRGGLGGGNGSHAGGVEDEGFYFGFGAVGGNFMAVPEKGDSGGVADSGDDFAVGVDGGVSGGDESFLADELSVGQYGNPGGFLCADDELESGGCSCGRFRTRLRESSNGYVTAV
jgi:hypothetical protein